MAILPGGMKEVFARVACIGVVSLGACGAARLVERGAESVFGGIAPAQYQRVDTDQRVARQLLDTGAFDEQLKREGPDISALYHQGQQP